MPPLIPFAALVSLALFLGVLLVTLARRRTEPVIDLELLAADLRGPAYSAAQQRALRRRVEVLSTALGERDEDRSIAETAHTSAPTAPAVPPPLPQVPDVHLVASWTSLSRELATRGELERAALALWAADLHVLAPHLLDRRTQLAARLEELPSDSALNTLRRAREVALSLVADAFGPVTAMLAPADHINAQSTARRVPQPETGRRRATTASDAAALLAVADHWRGRARQAAASGDLGLEGREAEMAAFEAILVDSAHHHGDERLTSVGLRSDLACVVVGNMPAPDPDSDPAVDETRVRTVLRQLLPHHERLRYDALAMAPGDGH